MPGRAAPSPRANRSALALLPVLVCLGLPVLAAPLLPSDPALFRDLSAAGFVERPDSFYDGVRRLMPGEPE